MYFDTGIWGFWKDIKPWISNAGRRWRVSLDTSHDDRIYLLQLYEVLHDKTPIQCLYYDRLMTYRTVH